MITTSSHQILWSSHCFWRISDSRLTVTMLLVVAVAMLLIIIFASCAQPLLIMGKSKHACCKEVMIACDERDYSSMSHVSKSGVDAHPDLRADKKTLGMLQSQQALNAIDEWRSKWWLFAKKWRRETQKRHWNCDVCINESKREPIQNQRRASKIVLTLCHSIVLKHSTSSATPQLISNLWYGAFAVEFWRHQHRCLLHIVSNDEKHLWINGP